MLDSGEFNHRQTLHSEIVPKDPPIDQWNANCPSLRKEARNACCTSRPH